MRFRDLIEASLPLGKPVNATGLTFGFEVEFLVRQEWYKWHNTRAVEELINNGVNDLRYYYDWKEGDAHDALQAWQAEGNEGDLADMLDALGVEEFVKRIGAKLNDRYEMSPDGELLELYKSVGEVYYAISDDISDALGIHLRMDAEEGSKFEDKEPKQWYMERDGSVRGNTDDDYDCEISSPVFRDVNKYLTALETILNWIQGKTTEAWTQFYRYHSDRDDGEPVGYTNGTCGLHINIGVPEGTEIDVAKLLVFAGEGYLARVWPRSGNDQTQSLIDKQDEFLGSEDEFEAGLDSVVDQINLALSRNLDDKHFLINPLPYFQGKNYIEFRAPGGAGYEKRFPEIRQHVMRFVALMRIACDPNARRQEYAKKLYAIMVGRNRGGDRSMAAKHLFRWMHAARVERAADFFKDGRVVVSNVSRLLYAIAQGLENGAAPVPRGILRIAMKEAGVDASKVVYARDHFYYYRIRPESINRAAEEILLALGAPVPPPPVRDE